MFREIRALVPRPDRETTLSSPNKQLQRDNNVDNLLNEMSKIRKETLCHIAINQNRLVESWGGRYFLLTVVVIVVTAAILYPVAWPVGFVVWFTIFGSGSLFLLVRWHTNTTSYRCSACGCEFEISVFTDFASLQVPDKKYLKCPQCSNFLTP